MINGVTEPNGALSIASNAAQALPKGFFTPVNNLFNSAATTFGSDQETNFHTAMLGLADEYSKIMGGGTASDTGRQQALNILKAGYSKGQFDGAVNVLHSDIAARKSAIIGDNRYLMRQYGNGQQQRAQQNPQQGGQPAPLQGAPATVPGLTNMKVNPSTGQRIGWNGSAWVDASTGQPHSDAPTPQQQNPQPQQQPMTTQQQQYMQLYRGGQ